LQFLYYYTVVTVGNTPRDVSIKPRREEFVGGMAPRCHRNFAATRDALMQPGRREYFVHARHTAGPL
jgi:hypothetical protein